MTTLEFRWTVSRGRETYGYNICSLWVDGRKVSSCNGGGYDMEGTALGNWIAGAYADRLRALTPEQIGDRSYGLTFHDPDFDPGKAVIGEGCADRTIGEGSEGRTVEEAESAGDSLGLERYQAFYQASSKTPTERHRVPLIDGACGISSVLRIMEAIGLRMEYVPTRRKNDSVYVLHDDRKEG